MSVGLPQNDYVPNSCEGHVMLHKHMASLVGTQHWKTNIHRISKIFENKLDQNLPAHIAWADFGPAGSSLGDNEGNKIL